MWTKVAWTKTQLTQPLDTFICTAETVWHGLLAPKAGEHFAHPSFATLAWKGRQPKCGDKRRNNIIPQRWIIHGISLLSAIFTGMIIICLLLIPFPTSTLIESMQVNGSNCLSFEAFSLLKTVQWESCLRNWHQAPAHLLAGREGHCPLVTTFQGCMPK